MTIIKKHTISALNNILVCNVGSTAVTIFLYNSKAAVPVQGWTGPEASSRWRLPEFKKVARLSAQCTVRVNPQEIFLVLISVRG